ncbi:hypothetical protein [Biostraticola tofi]|uniref:hypothetical protein n=1 Tax=Biostraticola tofi TaxID=466109 RepID=UPI00104DB23F|nr:hypothetical protein [Biostraticola tofi]
MSASSACGSALNKVGKGATIAAGQEVKLQARHHVGIIYCFADATATAPFLIRPAKNCHRQNKFISGLPIKTAAALWQIERLNATQSSFGTGGSHGIRREVITNIFYQPDNYHFSR